MALIRVTKEFDFEMAHALFNYDGLCRHIHGHSYRLKVTVIGEPITELNNPKLGMVIDFSDLKKIVNREIIDVFDHSFVVSERSGYQKSPHEMFERMIVVNYQPTSENLVQDFAQRIAKFLPVTIRLHNLRLYETSNSYAEWFAADNE